MLYTPSNDWVSMIYLHSEANEDGCNLSVCPCVRVCVYLYVHVCVYLYVRVCVRKVC